MLARKTTVPYRRFLYRVLYRKIRRGSETVKTKYEKRSETPRADQIVIIRPRPILVP